MYQKVISLVDIIYLTRWKGYFDCDVFIPDVDCSIYELINIEPDASNGIEYTFEMYVRKYMLLEDKAWFFIIK